MSKKTLFILTCAVLLSPACDVVPIGMSEPLRSVPLYQLGDNLDFWNGQTVRRIDVSDSGRRITIVFADAPPVTLTSYKYSMRLELIE